MKTEDIRRKLLVTGPTNPNKVEIWHIRGESLYDTDHHLHFQPNLGYVRGKYVHVVEHALSLKNFVSWGSGGSITAIKVVDVDDTSLQKVLDARARIQSLETDLHNAKESLKRLGGEK